MHYFLAYKWDEYTSGPAAAGCTGNCNFGNTQTDSDNTQLDFAFNPCALSHHLVNRSMTKISSPTELEKMTKMKNHIQVLMKAKNRALTVRQDANKQFVVGTTKKETKVEVRFQRSPGSHPFYVSFVFKHKSKKYYLYCKWTSNKPQLILTPEGKHNQFNIPASERSNLFKMTMDSKRYKFQSYLSDDWFLSVSNNILVLNNRARRESALFDLES
ncbi:uncharacterized protein LOC125488320 [Rhincodon typus]|uniref:uncharacterized protein LOC125488319 n=1 Tax=Rhincodon typus TaxID=259920 RepID=UPI0020300EAC|nr:uncharacterized protein LOC125488319 [Rhincodon typus]XP_048477240.1 uncharacterized protein LOC125488320 [Rhincodon typus]